MVKEMLHAVLIVTSLFIKRADPQRSQQGNLLIPKWEGLKDYTWSQRKLQGDCHPSVLGHFYRGLQWKRAKSTFWTCFAGKQLVWKMKLTTKELKPLGVRLEV